MTTNTLASKLLVAAASMSHSAADCLTAAEALMGDPGDTTGTGSVTGPGASPLPAADPYFPPEPTDAKYPSPEDSRSMVHNGQAYKPYVISQRGTIYQLLTDKPITNEYGTGYRMAVNFVPMPDDSMFVTELVVRQGEVYFAMNNAGFGIFEAPDGMGSGVFRVALPPPWVTAGTNAGGNVVPLPALPPSPPNPPLGNGKTILFGPVDQFHTMTEALATAQAGDIVQYNPAAPRNVTVAESVSVPEGVTLDLGGRWTDLVAVAKAFAAQDWAALDALYAPGLVVDGDSLADPDGYAHQNGAIVYLGSGMVNGSRIKNFGMKESKHGGTAALRAYGDCKGTISGRQNYITDCQNGIGPGGASIDTNFSETVIIRCGLGDGEGGAHSVYDSSTTVNSVYGPNFFSNGMASPPGPVAGSGGHALKSRAKTFKLIAPFHLQGTDSTALDRPDGSTTPDEIGAGVIEQCAGAGNHNLSGYAPESKTNGAAGQNYRGTTMRALCDQPGLVANGHIDFDAACKFEGNKITVPLGAPVTGLPA